MLLEFRDPLNWGSAADPAENKNTPLESRNTREPKPVLTKSVADWLSEDALRAITHRLKNSEYGQYLSWLL